MVKKLFSLMATGVVYLCVATIVALAGAFSALWFKGALDTDRLYRVLAALHGIDVVTLQTQLVAKENAAEEEQASYEEVIEARALKSLDLDLRETAVDKGLLDLLNLQANLQTDQKRFHDLKLAYDSQLKKLADEEQENSLKELQRTLEAIQPKQAKEQIIKMLADEAMEDVVAILKRMPLDKRKRIVGEFKQGDDPDKLYEILKNIRLGEPVATQIQEARDKLKQPTQN